MKSKQEKLFKEALRLLIAGAERTAKQHLEIIEGTREDLREGNLTCNDINPVIDAYALARKVQYKSEDRLYS